MSDSDLISNYVHACLNGALKAGECGPVWQLGVIGLLIVIALFALLALRLNAMRMARAG